jgi:hypothetical protein
MPHMPFSTTTQTTANTFLRLRWSARWWRRRRVLGSSGRSVRFSRRLRRWPGRWPRWLRRTRAGRRRWWPAVVDALDPPYGSRSSDDILYKIWRRYENVEVSLGLYVTGVNGAFQKFVTHPEGCGQPYGSLEFAWSLW